MLLLSHHSILPDRIIKVDQHINNNLKVHEVLQHNNKNFPAEFLFALDMRVQVWLQKCKAADHRDEVNDSIIDFSDYLNKILMRRFTIALPLLPVKKINGFEKEILEMNLDRAFLASKKSKVERLQVDNSSTQNK